MSVAIVVSGSSGTATGSVVLSSGSYTSSSTTLTSGSATITIAAGSLAAGADTLTAAYTPDATSSSTYTSASGTAAISVTQPAAKPTVTVTPAASSINTGQSLEVTVAVSGANGTPTGAMVLSSGSYTSAATTLSSGTATLTIPAGSLVTGSDTLTATYTPDSASSSIYTTASGTASVTVTASSGTPVTVNVDVLANRHAISPYVYGGNVSGPTDVADMGLPFARWGGNASSTYNWQLHTYNADNDYYFEDFGVGNQNGDDNDSVQFVTDVQNAGANVVTTMPMLGWVAQSAENSSNGHWSFSVATYGAQCAVDPYNTDAGDGLMADCKTPVTTSAVTTAYDPLLDDASQTCSTGNCVYRKPWAQALAGAFTSNTCAVPYSSITSCHFYDMDNEVDIWGGTHRDVHPVASGYDELANDFETEAGNLKTWDPAAVRFGPVSCCWWFYWNVGPTGDDKTAHAGVDFLPWWLNQINWLDQINGSRTLDVFDIHAYPDANTSGLSPAQLQAVAADVYRDYWDPAYVSTSGTINQIYATSMQPNRTIPFRIPRMKAMVNAIYPGTPLAFTEWSAAFYKESDFSTALGDADAYGIFGREGLSFATRWGAPTLGNPNYQALKLYTNYDGAHHKFGTVSVADTNTGDPNLFSSFAALNATGTAMTIMVINKDPSNAAQVTFNLTGFSASSYVAYSLSSTASSAIAASGSTAWNATQSFAPYSITLLVVTGTEASTPASEWYLNPDDLMIPAAGTAMLHPAISSGSANVTLSSAVFNASEGAPACSGSLTLTNATVTATQPGTITVNAGSTPGFCHYTVTGSDGTATQTQGGWIVVGNPAATLTQSGNNQSGSAGTALSQPLTVTLSPGQSGGTAAGAAILFTATAGTLSNGTTSGTSVIATTDSSGTASVTLTLPSSKGTVTVTAQDQFALGGASVTFNETAN
ncbi:MAG: glycoside hydrolase family 44 protein [Acidobacteriaceae bacterium]